MIKTLVIKVIRACNLRCSYCYYINESTPEYGMRMSPNSVRRLYETYSSYVNSRSEEVSLIWHGGEPLMLGRRRFQEILDLQPKYFKPGKVHNLIQTNGLLIDDKWIDFFEANDLKIGISLDGTRETHDKHRVTANGKGSYDGVLRAIRILHKRGLQFGAIGVVDSSAQGRQTIKHFRELGIGLMDFLLPISNHAIQRRHPLDMQGCSKFFRSAFEEWTSTDDPSVSVRLFEALIMNALGLEHNYFESGAVSLGDVVVIETNGDLCMDTDFSQIDRFRLGTEYKTGISIFDRKFDFAKVETALKQRIEEKQLEILPTDCRSCQVRSVCRAAHPCSRFDDTDNSFNHRSVYCEAMYALCNDVVKYLIRKGYAESLIDPGLRSMDTILETN